MLFNSGKAGVASLMNTKKSSESARCVRHIFTISAVSSIGVENDLMAVLTNNVRAGHCTAA